jgi:hypothetical protein
VRQQIPRKAVELHPLPAMPVLRAQGEARAVQRGPRTITQILQDARKAMELEDAYIAWLEGKPVPQLRHPRRTLRQWLTGHKPEPAPPMTEIVPVWRAVDPGGT